MWHVQPSEMVIVLTCWALFYMNGFARSWWGLSLHLKNSVHDIENYGFSGFEYAQHFSGKVEMVYLCGGSTLGPERNIGQAHWQFEVGIVMLVSSLGYDYDEVKDTT